MSLTVYGIRNCDTIKKTLEWLSEKNIDFTFHDYKKQGITEERLKLWIDKVGWEALVNKRGTTWRKLPEDIKEVIDSNTALLIMQSNPSIIKRPVITYQDMMTVGFCKNSIEEMLST